MKRKFRNWVRNEGEKRVLLLDGEISDETWWGDEVTPQMFRFELNQRLRDQDRIFPCENFTADGC